MHRASAYGKDADWLRPADSAIAAYVADLRARYARHDLPIEETRRLVDESMGGALLSDVLYKMRDENDEM